MKPRPLPPQEYLRECFDYDPETGVLRWRERPLSHFRGSAKRPAGQRQQMWNTQNAGQIFGHIDDAGYRRGLLDCVRYRAHRIIFKLMTDADPIEIDHRDQDKRNNRWSNLRNATGIQNRANTGARRHNPLAIKGVQYNGFGYLARIKTTHLGTFPTPEAAHAAYVEAARARWGEFAGE